jgi:hypothetical protein
MRFGEAKSHLFGVTQRIACLLRLDRLDTNPRVASLCKM